MGSDEKRREVISNIENMRNESLRMKVYVFNQKLWGDWWEKEMNEKKICEPPRLKIEVPELEKHTFIEWPIIQAERDAVIQLLESTKHSESAYEYLIEGLINQLKAGVHRRK